MAEFVACSAPEGHGHELDAFLRVRRSHFEPALAKSSVPALVAFGKHDGLTSPVAELGLLRERFATLSVEQFDGSAHYPHIEETQRFLDALDDTLRTGELLGRMARVSLYP